MTLSKKFTSTAMAAAVAVCFINSVGAQETTAPAVTSPQDPVSTFVATSVTEDVSPETVDPSADIEARKRVAPTGTTLNVAGETEETTASGPGLRVVEGKVVVGENDAEAAAVESMAQLIKQLNVVKAAPVGSREVDETTPTQLFDDAQVRALLGEKPTVVYQVVYRDEPIPDPMVVPWVRNVAVLRERFDEAVDLVGRGRVSQGREMLQSIVTEFPDTDYATQARELVKKIDELQTPQEIGQLVATPTTEQTIDIVVDPNLSIGSILVNPSDPSGSLVMIGGRSYSIGDTPRGFSNHKIMNVSEESVEVEVTVAGKTKLFTLPVGPPSAKR
ncbi:hypothetical protein CVU37_00235 [candidate division BRC1 bacterium HGW-BRC1-1]|jgi:hypothetical protein|nr:MAG: hypothetical protein CVU37_00235 [candidate division BRC1 bacterium HGW-BRC1-1]